MEANSFFLRIKIQEDARGGNKEAMQGESRTSTVGGDWLKERSPCQNENAGYEYTIMIG